MIRGRQTRDFNTAGHIKSQSKLAKNAKNVGVSTFELLLKIKTEGFGLILNYQRHFSLSDFEIFLQRNKLVQIQCYENTGKGPFRLCNFEFKYQPEE